MYVQHTLRFHPGEPLWRDARHYSAAALPPAIRYWLLDDNSLTSHLQRESHGDFSVQRLQQGWSSPLPSERRLLGMAAREQALVREVALICEGQTWVFARSVFPQSTLAGKLRHLRRLANSSLGALLFSNPAMHRSPFQIALLPGDSSYIAPHLRQPQAAWGRRSRFVIGARPLLVSEVFLQPFRPWPQSLPNHRSQRGKLSRRG